MQTMQQHSEPYISTVYKEKGGAETNVVSKSIEILIIV